jgi:hypothetical protein
MISDYLNQTATLNRSDGVAADGSRTYTDIAIKCRYEPKTTEISVRPGEVMVSSAHIFTLTPVKVGDSITRNGRRFPVISVAERWGRDSLSHYEVYL